MSRTVSSGKISSGKISSGRVSSGKISPASVTKKRGRPKNPYAPDALLPFRKNEIAPLEKFERQSQPTQCQAAKKTVPKRRTSPVTGIQHYSADEIEFMNALSEYKRSNGRVFPTCSEILAVLKKLGYVKANQ